MYRAVNRKCRNPSLLFLCFKKKLWTSTDIYAFFQIGKSIQFCYYIPDSRENSQPRGRSPLSWTLIRSAFAKVLGRENFDNESLVYLHSWDNDPELPSKLKSALLQPNKCHTLVGLKKISTWLRYQEIKSNIFSKGMNLKLNQCLDIAPSIGNGRGGKERFSLDPSFDWTLKKFDWLGYG